MNFQGELEELRNHQLFRELKCFVPLDATHLLWQGKPVVNFASNDYLGLSRDARVITAAQTALAKSGFGSGASRLICGTSSPHEMLEKRIATFKHKAAAVVFPTGYMTNVGAITAITGKEDFIVIDKLCHASIIDACKMAAATLRVFPHKKYARLQEILAEALTYRRRLIITDSVFSMDGDCADLKTLVQIKNKYNALLMIDEAHATGVFGDHGRGLAEAHDVEDAIDIAMGTLSKAVGGLGGFVAGSKTLIQYLHNKARSFIYTTALPAYMCAGLCAAIDIVEQDSGLRMKLWDNIRSIASELSRHGIQVEPSPIIPIIVGDTEKALTLSRQLLEAGFFVPAIRYPSVPKNQARLRISVAAGHTIDEIERMVEVVCKGRV